MHLLNPKILGIGILLLLCALVIVKRITTGSVLDAPKGSFLIQLVNSFNLFFLLFINPVTAILLIARREGAIDATRISMDHSWFLAVGEIAGLVLYLLGYLLMAWALIFLGNNYQIGGTTPRIQDTMVMDGPFRFIRHPLYTAALVIGLGLFGLTQSWVYLGLFGLYLTFILVLIPVEENGLRQVYAGSYILYQQKTKKLVPFVY
jgi:protein-S-isoprenylcysteine O-methyltransferase Ste14